MISLSSLGRLFHMCADMTLKDWLLMIAVLEKVCGVCGAKYALVPVALVSFNTSSSPLACFPQLLVSLVACFSVRLSAHEQFHLRRASIGSRISWHIYIPVTAMAHDCIYCVHTTTTTTPVGIPCQYLVYFVVFFFFFFAEELYYLSRFFSNTS